MIKDSLFVNMLIIGHNFFSGEDEANVARREGVRRKTYQYLQRAEQLLSRLTRHSNVPPQTNASIASDKVIFTVL